MLVKFGLPNGAGGMAAAHGASRVRAHIKAFEQQTNTTIRTWGFNKDYRHWLAAEIPTKHETLFALYMSDKQVFMRYEPLAITDPHEARK